MIIGFPNKPKPAQPALLAQHTPKRTPEEYGAIWGADLLALTDTIVARMVRLCKLSLAFSPTDDGVMMIVLDPLAWGQIAWSHEFASYDALLAALQDGQTARPEWGGIGDISLAEMLHHYAPSECRGADQ